MAQPNYSFQKRQKELAKKKKQEEKRLRKQGKSDAQPGETSPGEPSSPAPAAGETETPS